MGVKGQINKYKAAVGRRNIGSDPAPSTVKRAQDTAIGRNGSSSVTTNHIASPQATPAKPKGSWEGYMYAPSAPIQMEGTGYLAKSAQKARMPKAGTNLASSTPRSVDFGIHMKTPNCVTNYSMYGSKKSSVARLRDNMKLNDLFKG